jgi:hypothetical protein
MLAAIQKVGKWGWGGSKQQKAAEGNHQQGDAKPEVPKPVKVTKHSKTPSQDVELQSFSSSRNSSQLEEQAV